MRAPSLHDLSVYDALRASALRTPAKLALVSAGTSYRYAELLAQAPAPLSTWLHPARDENTRFAASLTHRELMLRVLELAVRTRAFSRDTDSAVAIAADTDTTLCVVALLAPLVVGGTVRRLNHAEAVAAIAAGTVNQAWLESIEALAPPLPASFRHALIVGDIPAARLDALFGAERWSRAA